MGSELYKIFEEVEVRAKLLAKYWNSFYTEISQHLPETYSISQADEVQSLPLSLWERGLGGEGCT
jgi:hypothetical protein